MDQKISLINNIITKTIFFIQTTLSMLTIAAVGISGIHLVRRLCEIYFSHSPSESYELFESFLGHTLLLVIGLELIIMLINHKASAVIEVMLYAVARKMLIYTHTTQEMLIGVVALTLIFFIRKYLFCSDYEDNESRPFSALIPGKLINKLKTINISDNKRYTIKELLKKVNTQEPSVTEDDIEEINDESKQLSHS